MPHLVPLWMTMSPSPLPLDRQKWSLKWNRFVQLARLTIAYGRMSKLGARLRSFDQLWLCAVFASLLVWNSVTRRVRSAWHLLEYSSISINKVTSFELIFSAHTTAGKLRMHNDIWRHQKDIPWAHAGCVWKRKRRRHFANRSMEETGQSISSRNL